MTKRLRLNDIRKELDRIAGVIRSDSGVAGDHGVQLKNAEQQLRGIGKKLKNTLEAAYQDLNTLKTTSSGQLVKVKQAASVQIEKIRDLIGCVNATLDHCRRLNSPNHIESPNMICGAYDAIRESHNLANPLDLTKQTIRLLDSEQYGNAGNITDTMEFSVPDLKLATHQRNCGLLEKIRLGKDSFIGNDHTCEDLILMPHFYHDFGREDDGSVD